MITMGESDQQPAFPAQTAEDYTVYFLIKMTVSQDLNVKS